MRCHKKIGTILQKTCIIYVSGWCSSVCFTFVPGVPHTELPGLILGGFMKLSLYNELIEKMLSERDNIENFEKMKDELKKDASAYESMADENKKLKEKVDELRDSNIRLFLKQSGDANRNGTESVVEEEKTDDDIFNELLANKILGD